MTPPKTFLRSILSPCPCPGRNIFLTLGWQGSSSALHQPPSPHFSMWLGGAMTRFKLQRRACQPPWWLYREMEPGAQGRPAQQPPRFLWLAAQQCKKLTSRRLSLAALLCGAGAYRTCPTCAHFGSLAFYGPHG